MDYSQQRTYILKRGIERESQNNCLVQAIPKSHNIRPIVQIKQKQAKIEDQLYLSKRKSDNHLVNGCRAPNKQNIDMVRSSKSYSQYAPGPPGPIAQARLGVSRNYTRVPVSSYNSTTSQLKKDLDNHLLKMDQKTTQKTPNQIMGAISLEQQRSQCLNNSPNGTRQFNQKRIAADSTPSFPARNNYLNPFANDMLRSSNVSLKIQVPYSRHSLPLKPKNYPITNKKLEGDDCDFDDGSMWSDRSESSKEEAIQFDDENYNPFGSDQKRKVVRFQTQSSQCDNTDTTDSQDSARCKPSKNQKSSNYIKVADDSIKQQCQQMVQPKEQPKVMLTKKSASDLVKIQHQVVYRQRQRSISFHKKKINVNMR